uniref:Histidine kinase-, DNA gyrase B-, and HSP90-like ATPase n=1 Tax=Candidatus Kentrum sp. FW TaxID=2126338 RepID=A0A450TRQ7_9GAMM|nr:MAG: Histidine kinase-, DNA gyrase B-, and HSP90-like ATPase [Candidatus Kentron sp. FW]
MNKITFHVDTRLAKLLSENYRSSERAIKELVDNAWDADSDTVMVSLPIAMSDEPIVIEDDGSGMTEEEIKREYLYIASDRRRRRGELTAQKKRKVKGKKGIGKFAGLTAANTMVVETWARSKKCEFSITTDALDSSDDIEQLPIDMIISDCPSDQHGTKITLKSLRQDLAFPIPDKLRQILLQEYGREDDFTIIVEKKSLGIDDVLGNYTSINEKLPKVGEINLRLTISGQKQKLKQPGIAIRVGGKVIGKPSFFGLDNSEDFPGKLLDKIYGEIEADGLYDHVTADWGALLENSELYEEMEAYIQPIIREKVREEYGREIALAQARLQKKVNQRLATLPQYKRQYADKAIKAILDKYYGELESKVEPIVSVLLDALERTDYRAVLDYIHDADRSDIAKLAEVLTEFGLAELAILGEQVKSRLEFLNRFEELCQDIQVKEAMIHASLEKNLWVFGAEYSLFSSNKTLKRQVEEYTGRKYVGDRKKERPDLMLSANFYGNHLLIEFKRPSHTLKYTDYQQATKYRNEFKSYISSEIEILVVGGKRGNDLPDSRNIEANTSIMIFDEVISQSRSQLNWLLKELGGETRA